MIKCEMCILVRSEKTSYQLCVSQQKLTADEELRPSHRLIAFPLFSYVFPLCIILLSAIYQPAKQVTESKDLCSPWRSTP